MRHDAGLERARRGPHISQSVLDPGLLDCTYVTCQAVWYARVVISVASRVSVPGQPAASIVRGLGKAALVSGRRCGSRCSQGMHLYIHTMEQHEVHAHHCAPSHPPPREWRGDAASRQSCPRYTDLACPVLLWLHLLVLALGSVGPRLVLIGSTVARLFWSVEEARLSRL